MTRFAQMLQAPTATGLGRAFGDRRAALALGMVALIVAATAVFAIVDTNTIPALRGGAAGQELEDGWYDALVNGGGYIAPVARPADDSAALEDMQGGWESVHVPPPADISDGWERVLVPTSIDDR